MANTYITSSPGDTGDMSYHATEFALAKGLGKLKSDLVIAGLVTNYTEQAKNQGSLFGQNVRVPKRGAITAATKTPGTAVTPTANTSTKEDIAVDQHKTVDLLVEDYGSLFAQKDLLAGYLEDGALAIAESVDSYIADNLYSDASQNFSNSISKSELLNIRKTARQNNWAMNRDFIFIAGPKTEEDILNLDNVTKVNESGDTEALRNAKLGRLLGFDFYASNNIYDDGGSEYSLIFQREALGVAFVDMSLQNALPEGVDAPGVYMKAMNMNDDEGNAIYSMRMILGYDQKERGTLLTVDSIFGADTVRDELFYYHANNT